MPPLFSIVMPVFEVEPRWLERAIESVRRQTVADWELCAVDDASPSGGTRPILESHAAEDPRIRVTFLSENLGIGMASNRALEMAAGEYVAFLDDDDELDPRCLEEVARYIDLHPDVDLVYTDEDKIDLEGERSGAVLKPDWSPGLFLTYNYLCHLVVCRRCVIDEVGGFRAGFDGSQDYDLLLRVTELTDRIGHIPQVLYHWRAVPGSAASRVDAKPYAFERSKQALRDAMARREIEAIVTDGDEIGKFRVLRRGRSA
jgi:glycosyltransferase involved in cell wall biosynthesis